MVEIYLTVRGDQIRFVSIPLRDISRLAIRPFKWLRFAMFCICGAKGQLSATSDGPLVDYDAGITSLTDDDIYYYMAGETFIFADPYYYLNELMPSTRDIRRPSDFRNNVMARDGEFCIVTGDAEYQAAHLVPKSKGPEYLLKVVQDRFHLYEPSQSTISDIDDVANGVVVSSFVHSKLSNGTVAFLKTPGYGLEAADIPSYDRGSKGTDRMTLHRLLEPREYDPSLLEYLEGLPGTSRSGIFFAAGGNVDALFRGTGNSQPSPLILDYTYGAAVYSLWGVGRPDSIIEQYFESHYKPILQRRANPPRKDEDDDDADDDSEDTGCNNRLAKAMDELNMVLMYLNGISPQEAANRWEKRMEEEQRIAREGSRSKVMEWMKSVDA